MKNGENGTESTATCKKVLISTEPSRNFRKSRKKIDKTTRVQELTKAKDQRHQPEQYALA